MKSEFVQFSINQIDLLVKYLIFLKSLYSSNLSHMIINF
jgi:hypothetical protein